MSNSSLVMTVQTSLRGTTSLLLNPPLVFFEEISQIFWKFVSYSLAGWAAVLRGAIFSAASHTLPGVTFSSKKEDNQSRYPNNLQCWFCVYCYGFIQQRHPSPTVFRALTIVYDLVLLVFNTRKFCRSAWIVFSKPLWIEFKPERKIEKSLVSNSVV